MNRNWEKPPPFLFWPAAHLLSHRPTLSLLSHSTAQPSTKTQLGPLLPAQPTRAWPTWLKPTPRTCLTLSGSERSHPPPPRALPGPLRAPRVLDVCTPGPAFVAACPAAGTDDKDHRASLRTLADHLQIATTAAPFSTPSSRHHSSSSSLPSHHATHSACTGAAMATRDLSDELPHRRARVPYAVRDVALTPPRWTSTAAVARCSSPCHRAPPSSGRHLASASSPLISVEQPRSSDLTTVTTTPSTMSWSFTATALSPPHRVRLGCQPRRSEPPLSNLFLDVGRSFFTPATSPMPPSSLSSLASLLLVHPASSHPAG